MKKYEEALARIISNKIGYTYGVNLFTSHIPDGMKEAVCITFLDSLDEDVNEIPKFNVQVSVKSASRSACQDILEKLRAEFPCYGETDVVSGIKFDEILRRGSGTIIRATDEGFPVFEMYFNIVAVFKNQ